MSDEFPLQSGWVLCWSFKGSQLRWLGNLLVGPWMPPWWRYSRKVPPKKALKKTKDEAWPWFTKESLWVPPDTSGSFLWFGRSVHICSSFNLAPNKRKKMDGLFYSKTASSCTSLRNVRVLKKVPPRTQMLMSFYIDKYSEGIQDKSFPLNAVRSFCLSWILSAAIISQLLSTPPH